MILVCPYHTNKSLNVGHALEKELQRSLLIGNTIKINVSGMFKATHVTSFAEGREFFSAISFQKVVLLSLPQYSIYVRFAAHDNTTYHKCFIALVTL